MGAGRLGIYSRNSAKYTKTIKIRLSLKEALLRYETEHIQDFGKNWPENELKPVMNLTNWLKVGKFSNIEQERILCFKQR